MAAETHPQLGPSDAVLVVDVQRDFCPGGALPVPEGDRVVGVLDACVRVLREMQSSGAVLEPGDRTAGG